MVRFLKLIVVGCVSRTLLKFSYESRSTDIMDGL